VALHRPETCPHGFPIPQPEDLDLPETPELYDLEVGDVAEVAVSGSTDAEIVSFLGTLGVVPGTEVTVVEKHPFDGPLVVEVEGQSRTLGKRVARQVYVTRTIHPPDHPTDSATARDRLRPPTVRRTTEGGT
jgi:DtxR family Mn-dependent transcriptional regulator